MDEDVISFPIDLSKGKYQDTNKVYYYYYYFWSSLIYSLLGVQLDFFMFGPSILCLVFSLDHSSLTPKLDDFNVSRIKKV